VSLTPSELEAKRQKEKKEEKLNRKKGHALGIDNLAVVEPMYYVIDDRDSEQDVLYIESEQKKLSFENLIVSTGEDIDLQLSLLTPKNLSENQTDRFNAIMKMKEWINEYYNHELDTAPRVVGMELNNLSSSIGTRYLALPQVFNVRVRNDPRPYIFSMFYLVTIPWAIAEMASAKEATYFRFWILDLDKLEQIASMEYTYRGADNQSTIEGCLYNTLVQIKREKR
jgi:hypothetical protein